MHRYHNKYSFFSHILDVWLFMKGAQRGKKNQTKKKEWKKRKSKRIPRTEDREKKEIGDE